jgi:hypothetical protein
MIQRVGIMAGGLKMESSNLENYKNGFVGIGDQ